MASAPEPFPVPTTPADASSAAQPQVPTGRPKGKALPVIDPARCTGCGWCVGACEPHVLSLHAVGWVKRSQLDDAPGCTGCALCAVKCPFDAIRMVRVPPPPATEPSA